MPKSLRDSWLLVALERERVIPLGAIETVRKEGPEWVADAVVAKGLASPELVAALAARAAHVPVADFAAAEPAAVQFVPETVARQYAALPLAASNRVIRIATANPLDLDAEQALGFVAGRQVEFQYATPQALFKRLDEVYRPDRSIERLVGGLATQATVEPAEQAKASTPAAVDAPATRLVEATIADAARERASDVHFEPVEQGLVIRYRIDGVLKEVMRVPRSTAGSVVRRLKVLARLDIADPLHAQEGRATARIDGRPWDLFVASAPVSRYGEQVTVRLVDPAAPVPTLASLGLWPDELALLEGLLVHREGIVLVAGPRGSGKSVTLYAALEQVRAAGVEVATVEEPVAYHIAGVRQYEVDEKRGVSYGVALRSALKEDVGAVLLGEIRDGETAAVAWQAALGGRLLLTTVRTNDRASALARLASLGIETPRIATAIKGLVTQRTVRRLCPRCAESGDEGALPPAARPPQALERPVAIRKAKGCAQCGFSGYNGRIALQELLTVDGRVAELIASGAPADEVAQAGRRYGMRTLWQAGIRRVWAGETTYEELVRVVGEPAPAAAEVAAPAPAPAPPVEAAAAEKAPLVLVADDDPAMRALFSTILRPQGFDVAEAADGLEALDQAQRLAPAILLLDMDMPRLDGFGVLEALRRRLASRAVPVIVVTAKDDPATEARCIELGAEDYLTKPIQPSSLVVRMRAVLRRVGA
ncbi:MAG TPA: type II/IV secretion system protein [Gemmatimonadales bacterium]|nr:type II/IV secretion system protein [Gemmatimonadales bacterium]